MKPGIPAGRYVESYEITAPARVVHLSGQTPVRPDGTLPEGFDAQCRQVWANVERALAEHGMNLSHLVKVTTYLSDRRFAEQNAAVRVELLGGHKPALTVVIAGIYDASWLLEIEAIAASHA